MKGEMNALTRFCIIPVIVIFTGLVLALPAKAILQLPHAFYGNLTIDGEMAPIGTKVEARGQGIKYGISGNPIMTTEVGKYGSEDALGVKLIVQGDEIEGNPTIYFYINDYPADQTYTWQSEEITRLDLSVTIPAETGSSDSGDTDGTSTTGTSTLQYSLFGEESNISITNTGEIQESIEISGTLSSGEVTVNIEAGTVALDIDGNPLTTLTSDANITPPAAPEGSTVYIACDFGPDGATFDPPIVLTFDYTSMDLPENTDEANLVIAFYDSTTGEWVLLDSEVDTVNHTISASVSHFTTFAILVPLDESAPPEIPPSELPDTTPEEGPAPAPSPSEPEPAPAPAEPTPIDELPATEAPAASEEPETTNEWNLMIIIPAIVVGAIVIALIIRWTMFQGKKQQ